MERSILHDLYFNNFSGFEHSPSKSREQKEAERFIHSETQYFKDKMSDDDCLRLAKLHDLIGRTYGGDDYNAFCYGFRLGMHLIIEGALVPVE